jgi:Mrp family chromosome partitioning ATPase
MASRPAEPESSDLPSATAFWQAKPTKKPSWLQVKAPRRPQATPESAAPARAVEPKAPPKAPELEPVPEPATTKPAATGLLDRLRQEFTADTGERAPITEAEKPRLGARLLQRIRRASAEEQGARDDAAKTTSKGAEMAALSPNDLRHYLTQRIASPDLDETASTARKSKSGSARAGSVLKSLDAVLDRVLQSSTGGLPRALLVAGVSPKADATQTAIGLARALVDRNEQVVLVDLAKGASAVSGPLGMPRVPGFADLAAGRASFADVIRVDGDTPLQVIPAGNPAMRGEEPEPDRFMRVFEALTQAYGCVVLHADLNAVRALMPALKFELPVMVAVMPARASLESEDEALSTFQALGCPVVVYQGDGRPRRTGLFSRSAAV